MITLRLCMFLVALCVLLYLLFGYICVILVLNHIQRCLSSIYNQVQGNGGKCGNMQLIEDSRLIKAKSQVPLKTLVIEEPSSTSQSEERQIKFHISEDPTGSGYTFSRIGWSYDRSGWRSCSCQIFITKLPLCIQTILGPSLGVFQSLPHSLEAKLSI